MSRYGPSCVDTIVIGAGPAGLATADVLSERGHRVLLLDEQIAPGGQIGRRAASSTGFERWPWPERYGITAPGRPRANSGRDGRENAFAALERPTVHYAPGSTVIDAVADDAGVRITWQQASTIDPSGHATGTHVHRVTLEPLDSNPEIRTATLDPSLPVRPLADTRAAALVLATGATERPLVFPGHTLPGILTAGALQALLKQAALVPAAGGLVLAGQGPLLLLVAEQVSRAGGRVEALLWTGPHGAYLRALPGLLRAGFAEPDLVREGARLLVSLRRRGIPLIDRIDALRAHGRERVERVTGRARGRSFAFDCGVLGIHDGVLPNTQLVRLLGLTLARDPITQDLVPRCDATGASSATRVWIAGDGGGIGGAPLAVLRGRLAGLAVHRSLTGPDRQLDERIMILARQVTSRRRARTWVDRSHPPLRIDRFADERTTLCRCEAVTLGEVRAAIAAGASGPNRIKTFTRCGMGTCQGRYCHEPLDRLLRQSTGEDRPQWLRVRPPLKPVLAIDYLAADSAGESTHDPMSEPSSLTRERAAAGTAPDDARSTES